jgi:hypothetical protein
MCERLPTDRVFLIRLSSDAEPAEAGYCGRIEHVQSGRVSRFTRLDEVEMFFSEMLKGARDE